MYIFYLYFFRFILIAVHRPSFFRLFVNSTASKLRIKLDFVREIEMKEVSTINENVYFKKYKI